MASLKPFQVQKPGRLFSEFNYLGDQTFTFPKKDWYILQDVEIGRLIFTFDPLCWERIIKIYPHYLHFQRNYTSSTEWRNKAGSFSDSIPLSHNEGRWRKVRFLQKLFTFFLCPYYHASILKSKRKRYVIPHKMLGNIQRPFCLFNVPLKMGT